MATSVYVSYTFADGECLSVSTETDTEPHPDLLDNLRVAAIGSYRDALGLSIEATTAKPEPES